MSIEAMLPSCDQWAVQRLWSECDISDMNELLDDGRKHVSTLMTEVLNN